MKNLFIVLFISIGLNLFAQNSIVHFGWANENPQMQPVRQVIDNGLSDITVTYSFEAATTTTKVETTKTGEKLMFQHLNIDGFSHLDVAGQAALPAHIDLIAVPKGADYQIEIVYMTKNLHNGYRIYPAREPARDTEGAGEPEFVMDEDYYSSDKAFPANPVSVVEEIEIRGMKFLLVQVVPVQYNPAKSNIWTYSNIKYRIKFTGANRFFDYENHSADFINTLAATPLNGGSILSGFKQSKGLNQNNGQSLTTNYLIITQNSLISAADSLAKWKRSMGYVVEVISAASWLAADVKTTIHNKYQSLNPKPDYFVILGDVQHVPPQTYSAPDASGTYGTDLYYACMGPNNDYVPEMAHGRISVADAAQAMMVVQKIINYERNPISDSSFYTNGLNCAQFQDDDLDGYADRRFTHTSEDVRDYVKSFNYNVERIYYTDANVIPLKYNASYYSNGQDIPNDLLKTNGYPWNGGATAIKNAINAGKFYVLHRDHGYAGGSGWAHPYFVTSSINTLSNGTKLPVVFSINCHTGEFTLSNCFAETFLRHSNGGAVGIFAASYYSYSGFNDGLSIGMFDGIWSNPGIIPAFGTGGNANPQVTAHADIINMGHVLNHGLLRMTQTWGGNNSGREYTYRLFHYFGDPAMRMWTKQPSALTAQHDTLINCSDTVFHITNCSDTLAVAALMSGNTLIGRADIINGSGTIYIQHVIGQNLKLIITARNRIPYIEDVQVVAGGGLSLNAQLTHNVCIGDSIGTIRVQASCGNPPYQISWADGATGFFRDSLAGGDYIFTITDSLLATLTDTITVWSPSAPISSAPVVSDAKCYFEANGQVNLNIAGGAQPYKFQWSNGQSGAIGINLSAGNYSVTVTDSAGCQFMQSFVVGQPTPLDVNVTYSDDIDNACIGTGSAVATGGTLPYTYLWNDPLQQTTPIITNLCAGLYKVTVKDSNLCTQFRTIIVGNTVGLENMVSKGSISVYPSPANDYFTIEFRDFYSTSVNLQLLDMAGRVIINNTLQLDQGKITVDVRSLSSGVYILHLFNTENIFYRSPLIIDKK